MHTTTGVPSVQKNKKGAKMGITEKEPDQRYEDDELSVNIYESEDGDTITVGKKGEGNHYLGKIED